ncbi:retinol-binding protein 2-like [Xyrauchen texanus]|uniref:retinol-binding protein 2-like n=1 Tax=Xyrauchen texanus TaxID=154827 RepID=UPI002241D433|nr:retinol-binding protein 2-like [Xyrauchen texanus]XP_051989248.1 retinol-binding protein 2-like [Xyrauchen texanus]XP_051989249.1 retinol-binding protein 2-like [Xyrauchen texanus]
MPADFNGKWELESGENLENYLKALDVDFAIRKIAPHLTPTKIFVQDGDNFVITTQTTFKSFEQSFTIGVEKEKFTKEIDNRKIKTLVNWEGDKLVAIQKGEKANRGWKHWIEGGKLYLELTCEEVVCHQVFKRKD